MELMRKLPDIIRESVKPMEQIDGIKIFQLEGLNGGASNGGPPHGDSGSGNGNDNLADQVINSALRYRSQAPLIDSLLDEVSLNGGDINKLTAGLHAVSDIKTEQNKSDDENTA
ncbi:MAG: flotillin domain-containing protein [Candidatus Thiodiazotropha endolucinida]